VKIVTGVMHDYLRSDAHGAIGHEVLRRAQAIRGCLALPGHPPGSSATSRFAAAEA
jgi:hypothetical protein